MPDISEHTALTTIKALCAGDGGTGKTGSLVSLVDAGYDLRILDTDRGSDILANLLKGKKLRPGQVQFETVEDGYRQVGGKAVPDGKGFEKAIGLCMKWSDGTNPIEWGPEKVFVVDSLTTMGRLSLTRTLKLVGKLGQPPSQPDWGNAINDLKAFLETILSNQFSCNVLVLTHVTYKEDDNGVSRPFPNALGAKFPTEINTYFNNLIGYKISGSGTSAKRSIETQAVGQLGLKTSNPGAIKSSYPIDTGLAQFFSDMGLSPPKATNA